MNTFWTFESSIPVALTKAGQSWKSPLPVAKASFLPSRSLGARMPFFGSEKMPSGDRGDSMPMATRSSPLPTQLVITPKSMLPKSYWPSPSVLHTSPEPKPRSMATSRPRFSQKPSFLATNTCVYPPWGIHGSVNLSFVCDCARAAGMPAVTVTAAAAVPARKLRRVILMVVSSARRRSGETASRRLRANLPVHYQEPVRHHDEVADPTLGGDELRHHHTDHRQRDGDLHAAEDERHGVGQPDLREDLPARAHVRPRHPHKVVVHAREPGRCVDHDGEEGDQEGQEQPRQVAQSEPHDEERCHRHLGDDLRDHDEWIEALPHDLGVREQDSHHHAAYQREQKAEHDLVERRPHVLEDERRPAPEDAGDEARPRQEQRLHAQGGHHRLPRHEGSERDRQWPQERSAPHGRVPASIECRSNPT